MEQVLKLDEDCEEAVIDLFNCKVLQLMVHTRSLTLLLNPKPPPCPYQHSWSVADETQRVSSREW